MDGNFHNPNVASNFARYRMNNDVLRIVMVGKTGIGKSATGNTILGRPCFESKFSAKSMTVHCSKGEGTVDGQQVAVIDTPGLFDTRFGMDKTSQDISQCISYASPGPHIFLVVIGLGRYTEEEKQTVQRVQDIFGQSADRYSMVLFTGGDRLKGTTIREFLAESSELQELVSRCNGQYHVFNNESKDHSQVTELLQKIRSIVQKNGGSHYTNEMFQEAERVLEEKKQQILKEKEEEIRKEKEELERKIKEKYDKEFKKIQKQLQAERENERKEREEEMKRERQEREAEKKREREEREAERMRDIEERKRAQMDMNEERRREREEREAERRRERQEREAERQERDAEKRRERQEREAERQEREAERRREMNRLQEQHDREMREKKAELQSRHEVQARVEAEDFNPLGLIVKGGRALVAGVDNVGKALAGVGKKIWGWFT